MTSIHRVTVFGGTGFLGCRIVRLLGDAGAEVTVASRHPDRVAGRFVGCANRVHAAPADIRDPRAVAAALVGADAAVNAVSLYVEHRNASFHDIHEVAAASLAHLASQAAVRRLVHVSGIGADARSSSRYISSRGRGEAAVQAAFKAATIVRPAVMVASDDAFLTRIAGLLRRVPAYPLFGRGRTRLQPVHVDDVGAAIVHLVLGDPMAAPVYELAGPTIYTYAALLRRIADQLGVRPALLPVPFFLWRTLGTMAERLPNPPLTRNQVELMQIDSVASSDLPGFETLGLTPRPLETAIREIALR